MNNAVEPCFTFLLEAAKECEVEAKEAAEWAEYWLNEAANYEPHDKTHAAYAFERAVMRGFGCAARASMCTLRT